MTLKPSDLLIREVGDLHLLEAASGDDGPFNPDGTVNVAILRPCKGRGPGSRIYTQRMLQESAGTFAGWPMYVNHDSPAARRARAGLPRPPSELGGEIRESFYDPSYTTPEDHEFNYLQGAVVGKFMPATKEVEEMVRRIPRQIKLSINATATGLQRSSLPEYGDGMLVEGIVNDPENSSVDLVTKAGAGGHVRQLLEAVYSGEGEPPAPLDDGDDMKLSEALRSPEVREYLIAEVLGSDEGKALIEAAVEDRVTARIAEHDAAGDRDAALRRLETKGRALIEATRLAPGAKALLLRDYSFGDDERPGRGLALIEAVTDSAGAVTKSADDVLKDAIEEDAKALREAVGSANPTVPFAPGAGGDNGGAPVATPDLAAFEAQARRSGMDPALFGMAPPKAASSS